MSKCQIVGTLMPWLICKVILSIAFVLSTYRLNLALQEHQIKSLVTLKWAVARDFQQFDILTSVDSDKPV